MAAGGVLTRERQASEAAQESVKNAPRTRNRRDTSHDEQEQQQPPQPCTGIPRARPATRFLVAVGLPSPSPPPPPPLVPPRSPTHPA